jgi:hypothetical protein
MRESIFALDAKNAAIITMIGSRKQNSGISRAEMHPKELSGMTRVEHDAELRRSGKDVEYQLEACVSFNFLTLGCAS